MIPPEPTLATGSTRAPVRAFTADLKVQTVDSEYAYILWSADTPDNAYEFATDTFVVRDGRIVAQSLAAKITPKA